MDEGTEPERLTDEERMQLHEEQLVVNKRRLRHDDVRVHKEIVTEVRSIEVPVSREELVIEHGEDAAIRIPLAEEKINVSRETIAREEVEIGVRSVEEIAHVSEVLQREALQISLHNSNEEENFMTTDSTYRGDEGGAIAATFPDRDSAHDALMDLDDAGFCNVWLGVTRGDAATGATVTSEGSGGGGFLESLGRFFTGEGPQEQALHQALIARGVDDDRARRLESTLPAGSAVVTVDGENDPEAAIDILQAHGGSVEEIYRTASTAGGAGVARENIDANRRLQLREERLLIDKERVRSGEARIRKEVVAEQQSVDVPVFHEELFIQRRPAGEGIAASTTAIGEDEEIRIPLSEERVDAQKRTVVTEEVEVGKRTVRGTERVSDTVRHEELRVDDDTHREAKTSD